MAKLITLAAGTGLTEAHAPTQAVAFSAIRMEKLDASEYTLNTLVIDVTGSLSGFESAIYQMLETVIDGCKKHPRADYLMLRIIAFSTTYGVHEIAGFTPIHQLNLADLQVLKSMPCSGMTNLYDAVYNGIAATRIFAQKLADSDYSVNALITVATDGGDNDSTLRVTEVADALRKLTTEEVCESTLSILIGLNSQNCARDLTTFHKDVNFTQYEPLDNLTPHSFAKLAQFISRSISAQSQALGTQQASAPLTL